MRDRELDAALEEGERIARKLAEAGQAVDAELHSAQLACGWIREMKEQMITDAVALGIFTTRAANLANTYYAETNPIGQKNAYSERLFLIQGAYADASHLDYARLGPTRNALEELGTNLTDQLNKNGTTLAISKVTFTASLALLDVASAGGLSKLAIGGAKALGGFTAKKLPQTANLVSRATTRGATQALAATSKIKAQAIEKFGAVKGGFNKQVALATRRGAGNLASNRARLVLQPRQKVRKLQKPRVLWTRGKEARKAAVRYAKSNGATTLEMTARGRILTVAGIVLPRGLRQRLWETASKKFATGAKGPVNVFFNPSTADRNSAFSRIELPELIKGGIKIIYNIVN